MKINTIKKGDKVVTTKKFEHEFSCGLGDGEKKSLIGVQAKVIGFEGTKPIIQITEGLSEGEKYTVTIDDAVNIVKHKK